MLEFSPKSEIELLAQLREEGELTTPRITAAFENVHRINFLPPDQRGSAPVNEALPIGYEQTNSQPLTVAHMLEWLQPQPGDQVEEIGAGTGWVTALLAEIVGKDGQVTGVERIPQLVESARRNLDKYDFPWATVELAGDQLGKPDAAPYDKILVSAMAKKFPDELLDQLAPGGTMVVPIGEAIVVYRDVVGKEPMIRRYPGYAFVPLRTDEAA